MKYLVIVLSVFFTALSAEAQINPDAIVGRWVALPKKNFIVEVFKSSNQYKAKIAWFKDTDDKSKPMKVRTDEKNPDPALRKRKLIGLEVLNNLVFNPKTNQWESGKIYDAKSGRIWDSSASLAYDGTLQVRGFWHFEFIGRNMSFKRV